MTVARLLTNKWLLVLVAVAILSLAAGQTFADHPEGGYRGGSGWSRGGSDGYSHREAPFRGERFGGYERYHYYAPPILVSPPVYRPYYSEGYYQPVYGGGCVVSGGPRVVIIIR
jgi:hypothetical protein